MNLSAFIVALTFANASAGRYGDIAQGYGQIAGAYYGNPFYGRVVHPGYGRKKRDAAPAPGPARADFRRKRKADPGYEIDAMSDTLYAGYRGKRAAAPGGGYGEPAAELTLEAAPAPIAATYHVIGKRAAAPGLAYAEPAAELTPEVAPALPGRRPRDASDYHPIAPQDGGYPAYGAFGADVDDAAAAPGRRKRDARPPSAYGVC